MVRDVVNRMGVKVVGETRLGMGPRVVSAEDVAEF